MESTEKNSAIKIGIFVLITALVSAYFGYGIGQWLVHADQQSVAALMFVFIGVVTLMLLQSIVIRGGATLAGIVALESLVMGVAVFASVGISQWAIAAIAVTMLLLLWASWRGQSSMDHALVVSVGEVGNAFLPLATTAVSILLAWAYVINASGGEFTFSHAAIASFLKPGEAVIRTIAPTFSFEATLGDFVQSNAGLLLKGQLAGLPSEARVALVAAATSQLQKTISDTFGIHVSSRETMFDILGDIITGQVKKIPVQYQTYIWSGAGVLLFFTLKGIGSLITIVVAWLAMILYKLFIAVGFASIEYEDRRKEIVVL